MEYYVNKWLNTNLWIANLCLATAFIWTRNNTCYSCSANTQISKTQSIHKTSLIILMMQMTMFTWSRCACWRKFTCCPLWLLTAKYKICWTGQQTQKSAQSISAFVLIFRLIAQDELVLYWMWHECNVFFSITFQEIKFQTAKTVKSYTRSDVILISFFFFSHVVVQHHNVRVFMRSVRDAQCISAWCYTFYHTKTAFSTASTHTHTQTSCRCTRDVISHCKILLMLCRTYSTMVHNFTLVWC